MSNYRPVYGKQLWNNDVFVSISAEAKIVYFYLLTNPESEITGIQKIRVGRIAYDYDIEQDLVHDALYELCGNDLIVYMDEAKLVYVYRYFHFSKGTIKNPALLAKCIQRQRELIQNKDIWNLFDDEYNDELLSINKVLMNYQTNKDKDKYKDKNYNKVKTNNNNNSNSNNNNNN